MTTVWTCQRIPRLSPPATPWARQPRRPQARSRCAPSSDAPEIVLDTKPMSEEADVGGPGSNHANGSRPSRMTAIFRPRIGQKWHRRRVPYFVPAPVGDSLAQGHS